MPLGFPTTGYLHKLWGRPPGLRLAPWPAFCVRRAPNFKWRAGPGGPARTGGSAPLDFRDWMAMGQAASGK